MRRQWQLGSTVRTSRQWPQRGARSGSSARRVLSALLAPVMAFGGMTVPALAAASAAVLAVATAVAKSAPANASTTCSGSVLVFPNSVNGGSSSAEAAKAAALGCTVTMFSSSAVSGMTTAQMITYFGGFTAIIIGDPSTSGTCSTTVPSDALTYAADWGPAVNGNVAVLGTAPVLAGSAGSALLNDAITWTTSSPSGDTGLYASLNCEYRSASANTAVPLLASVAGGGFAVTGQAASCPSNSGSVNDSQALANSAFINLTSSAIGPWSSPACAMEETFNAWSAGLTGLAYDAGATPASFTASDSTTGQAYVLSGTLDPATLGLSPSTGGQTPPGAAFGASNAAAPGVSPDTAADPVNTENGDFTQSGTDLSIPTFGPSLDFTRTYDAMLARQETVAGSPVQPGAPGSMGTDGLTTRTAPWRPACQYLATSTPLMGRAGSRQRLVADGDAGAGAGFGGRSRRQYVYRGFGGEPGPGDTRLERDAVGHVHDGRRHVRYRGQSGGGRRPRHRTGRRRPARCWMTRRAWRRILSGNLYIADTDNNRVLEIPASSGQNRGFGTMTVGDFYTVAGHGTGAAGHMGDGGLADGAFLDEPSAVSTGHLNSDIYIADSGNNRIQEVPAAERHPVGPGDDGLGHLHGDRRIGWHRPAARHGDGGHLGAAERA